MALLAEYQQVQARTRSAQGAQVLLGYRTSSIHVAAHYDTNSEVVASAVFLGGCKSL